jgi:hypothetical protein
MPMSTLRSEDVAHLQVGDYVEAWFERTERPRHDPNGLSEPTGVTYQLKGALVEHDGYPDRSQKGLSMPGNAMAIRQVDGAPGTWLVSIAKHVPAEQVKS